VTGSVPQQTIEAAFRGGLFQWKSHQRKHPNIAHNPRLKTTAKIHGLGDEKRITLLGLAVSTFKLGLAVSTFRCGGE
jgi:hypothetical protein